MYGRVGLLMAAETEGSKLAIGPAVPGTGERERKIYLHEKNAGNQKGKCPSTLVPILNQIINN